MYASPTTPQMKFYNFSCLTTKLFHSTTFALNPLITNRPQHFHMPPFDPSATRFVPNNFFDGLDHTYLQENFLNHRSARVLLQLDPQFFGFQSYLTWHSKRMSVYIALSRVVLLIAMTDFAKYVTMTGPHNLKSKKQFYSPKHAQHVQLEAFAQIKN